MHRVTALAFLLAVTAILAGCGEKKYKVDYDGRKGSFSNAKDYYKAGEQVTVWMEFIATDTDYSFYLDDEPYNAQWDERGYVISFVMPDHDVKLTYSMRNSMEYRPPFDTLRPEDQIAVFGDLESIDGNGMIYRIYRNDGGYWLEAEDMGFSRAMYSVQESLYTDMKQIVLDSDMASWNQTCEKTEQPEGSPYMNAILDDGEDMISADVTCMPENGAEVFERLRTLFKEAAEHSWQLNYEVYGD